MPTPASEKTFDSVAFGYLVYVDDQYIYIDPAEYYEGERADAAARKDGVLASNQTLRNSYYIRNPEQTIYRLTADPNLSLVYWLNAGESQSALDLAEAKSVYCTGGTGIDVYGNTFRWLPVTMEAPDGVVTQVMQQYLPKCCKRVDN